MRDSDWLKINLRLIFLICVQTQILCNGASMLRNDSDTTAHFTGMILTAFTYMIIANRQICSKLSCL